MNTTAAGSGSAFDAAVNTGNGEAITAIRTEIADLVASSPSLREEAEAAVAAAQQKVADAEAELVAAKASVAAATSALEELSDGLV